MHFPAQPILYTACALRPQRRSLVMMGLLAVGSAACATSGAVPRPFPGAPPPCRQTQRRFGGASACAPPRLSALRRATWRTHQVPICAATGSTAAPSPSSRWGSAACPTAWAAPIQAGFDCSGLVQYVFAQYGVVGAACRRTAICDRREDQAIRDQARRPDLLQYEEAGRRAPRTSPSPSAATASSTHRTPPAWFASKRSDRPTGERAMSAPAGSTPIGRVIPIHVCEHSPSCCHYHSVRSMLAAAATPPRRVPAPPPALTAEQIALSESLAPKFDQAAAREQARLKTFANRPLGGAIQRSFNVFTNYLVDRGGDDARDAPMRSAPRPTCGRSASRSTTPRARTIRSAARRGAAGSRRGRRRRICAPSRRRRPSSRR